MRHLSKALSKPAHCSKKAGHEVSGVVAVLCESLGMGGYREGDMPRIGLSVPFAYHLKTKTKQEQDYLRVRLTRA